MKLTNRHQETLVVDADTMAASNDPAVDNKEGVEKTMEDCKVSMLAEEENYPEPATLQEELNSIVDAFYDAVPEKDIRAYQRYVEDIRGARIAEQALKEPAMAPTFELEDQEGDGVSLAALLKKGPVVLTFYRGKWCPHCNATLIRYSRDLVPALQQYNATLVAISPMLPDGTAFLATKRDLQFSVCSDWDCQLAKQFGITFTVEPHSRPFFTKWGDDLPEHNGVDSWDIPLPATYVIAPDGHISWSFLDYDPAVRGEVPDIVEQVAKVSEVPTTPRKRRSRPKLYNRKTATTFHFGVKAPNLKFWNPGPPKAITSEEVVALSMMEHDDSDNFSASRRSAHSDGEEPSSRKSKRNSRRKTFERAISGNFLGKYLVKDDSGISQ